MGLQRLLPCELAMGLGEERRGKGEREGEQESPLLRCGSGAAAARDRMDGAGEGGSSFEVAGWRDDA